MRRRDFIIAVGGAAAWPFDGLAQETGRTYRLGAVSPSPREAAQFRPAFEVLRQAGFIEGQNLFVDWWAYGQQVSLVSEFATAVVKAQSDVIFAGGDFAIRAAQSATSTIPIVGFTDDMLGSGLVNSLARPEGNTTGFSLLAGQLDGKRQELLMEAVPSVRSIATLADTTTSTPQHLTTLQKAAHSRGVELTVYPIAKIDEIASAVGAAMAANTGAFNILASPLLFANRRLILEPAAAQRKPTMFQWPDVAEEGGLMGYGPRLVDLWRDSVIPQIIKVLRGAKPAELPIQQPTKFELVINLKTAKAIDLDIPAGLVLRADKLIE